MGAGNVGAAAAAAMVARGIGHVLLYDAVEDVAIAKAMDISHATGLFRHGAAVKACHCPGEMEGADVVVIAAGAPRQAGMIRRDLLRGNLAVCESIGADVHRYCPAAGVLVVTNPVDILTTCMKDRWPEMNVLGLGCTLDVARLRFLLADAAGVAVDGAEAMVIGAHCDDMVPLVRLATIDGRPAPEVLTGEQIARVVDRTRRAGDEIVRRLKNRGSFFAAAYCVAAIVEAIAGDRLDIFSLSVPCHGEYGQRDVCLALPCAVGRAGVARIVELDLDSAERAGLDVCAAWVRQARDEVG